MLNRTNNDGHCGPGRKRVRYVMWWGWVLLNVNSWFAVALFLSKATSGHPNEVVVIYGTVWLIFSLYLGIRSLRFSTITFGPDEVVIPGLFRTRRIPWTDIRSVGVGPGTSTAQLPFRVPYFELHDGTFILANDIRSLRTGTIVDAVVEEARRRISTTPENSATLEHSTPSEQTTLLLHKAPKRFGAGSPVDKG